MITVGIIFGWKSPRSDLRNNTSKACVEGEMRRSGENESRVERKWFLLRVAQSRSVMSQYTCVP